MVVAPALLNLTVFSVVATRASMTLPLEWVKKTIDDHNKIYYFDLRYKKEVHYTALEAAQRTIKYIVENYPQPYRLYLSGGIDSQAMLYAWNISGVEYETYSAVYNYNLNDHDLVAIRAFADIHNIKINFVDFDLIDFFKTEHDYYAKTYLTGSPQFTSFMKMVSLQEEGTAIMSGNFLQCPDIDSNKNKIYSNYPCKNGMGLYHYARKTNKNFIPFFFLERPELAYAFEVTNYVKQFIENYGDFRPDLPSFEASHVIPYLLKGAYYKAHGFPVLEQYKKLNGFEKVKNFYDENYTVPDDYHKLERVRTQTSTRVFDILYRNRYEVKISNLKHMMSVGCYE